MPELPEVETVRRSLSPRLIGSTIEELQVRSADVIGWPELEGFRRQLVGNRFVAAGRRGKYLLLQLSHHVLVVHLRMTGRLVLVDEDTPEFPHTHVIMNLDGRRQLRFSDVRRFGRLYLYPTESLPVGLLRDSGLTVPVTGGVHHAANSRPLGTTGLFQLGPEPLGPEFSADYLAGRLTGRRAPIKAILLDQRIVAGLGNIYVDEALFRARIHPATPAGNLSEEQVEALCVAVKDVLKAAIAAGGTTFSDYRDGRGATGKFQEQLRVFARGGAPCHRCGTAVVKTRLAGRGTHFCPQCQPTA